MRRGELPQPSQLHKSKNKKRSVLVEFFIEHFQVSCWNGWKAGWNKLDHFKSREQAMRVIKGFKSLQDKGQRRYFCPPRGAKWRIDGEEVTLD